MVIKALQFSNCNLPSHSALPLPKLPVSSIDLKKHALPQNASVFEQKSTKLYSKRSLSSYS